MQQICQEHLHHAGLTTFIHRSVIFTLQYHFRVQVGSFRQCLVEDVIYQLSFEALEQRTCRPIMKDSISESLIPQIFRNIDTTASCAACMCAFLIQGVGGGGGKMLMS